MTLLRLLAVAGLAAGVLPALPSAQAQEVLNADALAQFGGTYRVRCDDRASPQVVVSAGSLVVTRARTRVTGQGMQAAYSWFGQSPPADFQAALLSQVKGLDLMALVYRGAHGQFLTLDGAPRVMASLGTELSAARFMLCRPGASLRSPASIVTAHVPARDGAGGSRRRTGFLASDITAVVGSRRPLPGAVLADRAARCHRVTSTRQLSGFGTPARPAVIAISCPT